MKTAKVTVEYDHAEEADVDRGQLTIYVREVNLPAFEKKLLEVADQFKENISREEAEGEKAQT